MKRILTSALAIVLFAGAAQAQNNSGKKQEMHQKQGDAGLKQLNLTAEQKAQIKALHEQEKAEADALKNSKLTVDEHMAKRKELHEKYMAQMKTILTPAQQQQLATFQAQHGDMNQQKDLRKRGEEMKRNQGEPRDTLHARHHGDEMQNANGKRQKEIADELNLTADQKAKMKNIRQDYKAKLDAVRNDNSLTQDQKKAKFQELMKAQQDEMKTILTKEQADKMESLRKQRGGQKVKK
jgi:Spy/CpxP family protein refolding chaperone